MWRARVQVPFHALVAVVLTWPLVDHLTDALPLGTESTATVPLFNLWTLRWDQAQLGDGFRHYWDAPIFHPTPGAFALSEPQPLTGLVFAPLSWLTHNPVLAYNLVLLLILTLNGWAAARLARRLGAAPGPAAAAGVLAQAMPFVLTQLGVLQLTVVWPIFLLFDALLAWASAGGRRRAAVIGVWVAVTFLTCGYYGLFVVLAAGVGSLALVRRSWLTVERGVEVLVALGTGAVLTLPVLVGQARITADYERSASTITGLSALPVDLLRLWPGGQRGAGAPWLASSGGTGHWLYPGTVLVLGGAVGLVLATRRATRDAARRPAVGFLVAVGLVALLAGFGLRLGWGDVRPYELLRAHVPGFANLRSPYRFSVLVQVVLVAFTSVSLDALWRWRVRAEGRSPAVAAVAGHAGAVAVALVVLLGVAEVSTVPIALVTVDPPAVRGLETDWVRWLADHPGASAPGASGDGSVAVVPPAADGRAESYEPTVEAMLAALDHGHPLVNGYSGFFPASADAMEADLREFPSDASIQALRDAGVTYVVVDHAWLGPVDEQLGRDHPGALVPVFTGRDATVYRVERG